MPASLAVHVQKLPAEVLNLNFLFLSFQAHYSRFAGDLLELLFLVFLLRGWR